MTPSPFKGFNFSVEIVPEGASAPLCGAAFAECDGLELTMEVKSLREGGNNGAMIRLAGPASFGTLTLKRGMTSQSLALWSWFSEVLKKPSLRAVVTVALLDDERERERARFVLSRCLPVRLKAPALNAKEGLVAIEEIQIAYQSMSVSVAGAPAAPAGAA